MGDGSNPLQVFWIGNSSRQDQYGVSSLVSLIIVLLKAYKFRQNTRHNHMETCHDSLL